MENRLIEWDGFSQLVREHIETYCIPQYGDNQAGAYSATECCRNIERYTGRCGKNMRGDDEQRRDFLKMAHYACLAYFRYLRGDV